MANSYTAATPLMRIEQARNLATKPALWVGVGKTTAWTGGDVPPEVSPTTQFEELAGLKRAEVVSLVVPDANGEIEHLGEKWRKVAFDPNAADMAAEIQRIITEGARWVYVAAWLRYSELPLVSYRQVGVFADTVLKADTPPGKLALLPTEIDHAGLCVVINNRDPLSRAADQKELQEFVIEF